MSIFERYLMYIQLCELAGLNYEETSKLWWFSLPNYLFISLADTQEFLTDKPDEWLYPEDKYEM